MQIHNMGRVLRYHDSGCEQSGQSQGVSWTRLPVGAFLLVASSVPPEERLIPFKSFSVSVSVFCFLSAFRDVSQVCVS